jgi:ribosomal protein S18 acetylase RimI-like enzyme
MIIREAIPPDIPSIIDFQFKMALETEGITLDIATLSTGVNKLFRNPHRGKYYVAETPDEIVGCLMTTFEWSDWRDGNILWIQSVYILEDFRGRGVYKMLYHFIQEIVKTDPELKGIRLYVDNTNKIAQSVYSKLGMNGDHYRIFEWMNSVVRASE